MLHKKTTICIYLASAALSFAPTGAPASNVCPKVKDVGGFYRCDDPPPACPTGKQGNCVSVKGANGMGACDACPVAGGGGGCLCVGLWGCQPSDPLAQNMVITFTLVHEVGNHIEIADFSDIDLDGMMLQSQVLNAPGDFVGTFELTIESGPPEAIPVRVTAIDLTASSVDFMGQPSGTNSIQLAPDGSTVVGVYDSINDIVNFDQGIPATVVNNLFPGGIEVTLAPAIVGDGGSYELHPIGVLNLPPPVPAISNLGMMLLIVLILAAAMVVINRRQATVTA